MILPPEYFHKAGCSVIPIRLDGSKAPAMSEWKQYQQRQPLLGELKSWFPKPTEIGFGVICGAVSGGLEVIDFDIPHDQSIFFNWYRAIELIAVYLSVVETPNYGFHVYYRCQKVCGNSKIATDSDGKTLIETRGEGGYVVGPGSSARCHSLNRPYIQTSGPALPDFIPLITPEQRCELWSAARRFDKSGEIERLKRQQQRKASSKFKPKVIKTENRPGDDFNRRESFPNYLIYLGWTSTDGCSWTRPGKQRGVSATLRQCDDGHPVLVNFSSNSGIGLDGGHKTLSLFDLYTKIEHNGNYLKSAATLRQKGFGK